MIRSIAGILVELEAPQAGGRSSANASAVIEPEGAATGYEVLLPGFLAPALEPELGQPVRLRTLHYLESQGQGTSFIPRLIGFTDDRQRRFFEAFTTVKGLGYRRALRALAEEPGVIASLIASKDAKGLTRLPEVGKRLAETIIAELTGKVDAFIELDLADGSVIVEPSPRAGAPTLPPVAADAVEALVTLGQPRSEAERRVETVLDRMGEAPTAETLVQKALGG